MDRLMDGWMKRGRRKVWWEELKEEGMTWRIQRHVGYQKRNVNYYRVLFSREFTRNLTIFYCIS